MDNYDKNDLTQGVIWKKLLAFFFPILLGMLFQQLYNTVDAIVVGKFVGTDALAAVGGSSAAIVPWPYSNSNFIGHPPFIFLLL